MIVPPRSSHAAGIDVVGDNVGVVGELFIADTAFAFLGHNLLIQQLSHFRIGADLPISARVLGIVNAPDSHLPHAFLPLESLLGRSRIESGESDKVDFCGVS